MRTMSSSSSKSASFSLGLCFLLLCCHASHCVANRHKQDWPQGGSTRFYDFKVQKTRITKLCRSKEILTINGMFPWPTIYAHEGDRVIIKVTYATPQNTTIHWHGVRQLLSCWSDGPSYITQCPIQAGQTFSYEFTLIHQKGTLWWHAHISWMRAMVHGAIVIYPKKGVPYPFKAPYEEHVLVLGEYWHKNELKIEKAVVANGGGPPKLGADVFKIDAIPEKTYLLRLVNSALNTELFFTIANHKLNVVEADSEYVKPFLADRVMITPGQTLNVLVKADKPIGNYAMSVGPYMSAQNVPFQNISATAYFQYSGASLTSIARPAKLPIFNDSLAVKSHMDGLKSLNATHLPLEIDTNLIFTIGLNVDQCNRPNPNKTCQGPNNGIFAASMNNITFVKPNISLLQAYYEDIKGQYKLNFPSKPLKAYDFINGAPNSIPNNTASIKVTRVHVLEYGARVQLVLQDIGMISTESHPIHLHGYYVVGYGSGNYNPSKARLNLVDPPYMNTIGVLVGGWAIIRFIADNPGVWFMHCHLEIHTTWGLSMAFIVKNGKGPHETLPHPPSDIPRLISNDGRTREANSYRIICFQSN